MKSYESNFNKNFTLINNGKLALKKSSPDNDNFDVLFFADKSLTEVVIPKFVRFIAPYSFFKCGPIVKVEFEKNSQLQEIGRNAFAFNHFTKIEIPPSLKHICEESFFFCRKLRTIEIPSKSELRVFERNSLIGPIFENFTIPSKLVELDLSLKMSICLKTIKVDPRNNTFKSIENNRVILKKSSLESTNFDVLLVAIGNIERIRVHILRNCVEI